MRLLRRRLRNRTHAPGLRRRRRPEQDRALPAGSAGYAWGCGVLRARRRRQRRVWLHVAAGLPRRLPEGLAAGNADRVHSQEDGDESLGTPVNPVTRRTLHWMDANESRALLQ